VAENPEGLEAMSTLEALADRVAHGAELVEHEAAMIVGSHDLIAIGAMADDVRRQLHGLETTFVRVFEMHVDGVPPVLPPNVAAGEFRIVGRPTSIETACSAVAAARQIAGATPLTGFSLADLVVVNGTSPGAFRRLKEAGLDGIAEAAADHLSTAEAPIAEARAAGLRLDRLTVHSVPRDPVALVARALQIQRTAGGFHVFAPLPRIVSAAAPTTGYDDVKLVAVARLLIRDIQSIQVDWPLYGPKLAQVALTVGADDVDGVAAADAGALGARRSAIEEIKRNIRAAGLHPVERNGRYERVA
jgi:2-iminoacetate synthase ThiH